MNLEKNIHFDKARKGVIGSEAIVASEFTTGFHPWYLKSMMEKGSALGHLPDLQET